MVPCIYRYLFFCNSIYASCMYKYILIFFNVYGQLYIMVKPNTIYLFLYLSQKTLTHLTNTEQRIDWEFTENELS